MRKILIMGLPGAGKTTLAKILSVKLNAVWYNADEIRNEINKDLGFTEEDRIEQARRMGLLCNIATRNGSYAIADFVCPTSETRKAFGNAFVVWIDRIKKGRFADTNKLFEPPKNPDIILKDGTPDEWANEVLQSLNKIQFDWKAPTAMFLGRYQPFHDGHKALIEEGIKRVGQVAILVRDTKGTDEKNPFDFEFVKKKIDEGMAEYIGKYIIVYVPYITNIFYGRDVGYGIERIHLNQKLEDISATKIRKKMFKGKKNGKS